MRRLQCLLLFFLCSCLVQIRLLNCSDGVFLHRDPAVSVVTELNDDCVVHDVYDHTLKSACGKYRIAGTHAFVELFLSCLLLSLGTDGHEIEHSADHCHV